MFSRLIQRCGGRPAIKRLWFTAATVVAGTVANDCNMLFKDSFVSATKATLASLLAPGNFDFNALTQQLLGMN